MATEQPAHRRQGKQGLYTRAAALDCRTHTRHWQEPEQEQEGLRGTATVLDVFGGEGIPEYVVSLTQGREDHN